MKGQKDEQTNLIVTDKRAHVQRSTTQRNRMPKMEEQNRKERAKKPEEECCMSK